MEKKYIKDKDGNPILPITHMSAVRDDNGNSLDSVLGAFEDNVMGTIDERMDEQDDKIALLNGSEVIVVADHTQVSTPDPQKIYREQGSTSYTDWMYQDGAWKEIATYDFPGIDNEPTAGSENLVKSGGVADGLNEMKMFKSNSSVDFTNDVLELWLSNIPNGEVKLQSYSSTSYGKAAYLLLGGATPTVFARTDEISENETIYPIRVYQSSVMEFPNNTVVGYIMFRDVASFKAKESSYKQVVNADRCKNIANSPLIATIHGDITAKYSLYANNATNETNVVDISVAHSSFVRELYLFGAGVDRTKSYKIVAVSRNHSTYKYSIIIREGSTNVSILSQQQSEPQNPVLIPPTNNSGVSAYAYVRWDEFDDNSNNSVNIQLLPRIFNLNYSPLIKEYLETVNIQGDITGIENELVDIKDEIDVIGKVVFETVSYHRGDFKKGYIHTENASIGSVVTIPNEDTPVSAESVAGFLVIPIKADEIITCYFKSLSNKWCRAYLVLDSSKSVLSWADPQTNESSASVTYNTFDAPLTLKVSQDGYVVIQFTQGNYNDNESLLVEHKKAKGVTPGPQAVEDIEVCVPDTIYAVVGDTLQLYYRSVFRCVDYSPYDIKATCDIGRQYPRYYEVTPLASNVGTHSLSFIIKDNNNNTLGEKTVNLVVVSSSAVSPSSELNVLCLGASATQGGQWASEFKRRILGTGGTPEGSGLSNIRFVGRKDVTYDGKQVNLEGTGGYTFSSYTNPNTARYRFNFDTQNVPIVGENDVYSNNGNSYTVKELNLSNGYFSCEGTGMPLSSGTLTKVSGTGSETISYTSSSFSGNPFAYSGVIDMQRYADEFCNPQGATHGRIDVIYTELFGNGTLPYTEDFTTRMSQMQTFISQVINVFPNCKFCIGLFWNPDIRGGLGVDYGASNSWSYPYGIKYSNMNLCNALQKYITDNNLSDYVYILNWLNEFDVDNDMQQTTKKVNPRSSVTEIFGVNGVHPSTVGYYQMADTAWRLFVAKFCQ